MTARKDPAEKAKTGRPTAFKPAFVEQAKKACEAGFTDREIATLFGVTETTINNWKNEHPEFLESLKAGKSGPDDRVKRSLFHRAVGYSYDAVKIFMPAGATEPVYAPYVEHVPPDTTAAIFWLKNRDQENWRDMSRTELTGKDGAALAPMIVATMTPQQAAEAYADSLRDGK